MRRSTPEQVNAILKEFIKEFGLERGLKEAQVYAIFEELTGKRIAKAITRKYIYNRMLVLQLSSSIARSELMMIRTELAAEINRQLGERIIDGILLQ